MSQPGADPLARFDRPLPHPEAAAGVRVRWMREGARLMVRLIALDATLAPTGDHSRYVEALGIVQGRMAGGGGLLRPVCRKFATRPLAQVPGSPAVPGAHVRRPHHRTAMGYAGIR
jgi:hypothetical protein